MNVKHRLGASDAGDFAFNLKWVYVLATAKH
jgi:hypothetical protein